jgi:uncharacterized protein YegP (UPF0339 family)
VTLPKQEPRPERNTWFELVRTDAGWHVRLVAANGETVMSSEVHPDRRDAEHVYRLCRGARAADRLPRRAQPGRRAPTSPCRSS